MKAEGHLYPEGMKENYTPTPGTRTAVFGISLCVTRLRAVRVTGKAQPGSKIMLQHPERVPALRAIQ